MKFYYPQQKSTRWATTPSLNLKLCESLKTIRAFALLSFILLVSHQTLGQTYGRGLPTAAPTAGTHMGHVANGARISAFHNGYLFLPQSDGGAGSSLWDISNLSAPVKAKTGPGGGNGHMWAKIGNLFWRQYSAVGEIQTGSGEFLDMGKFPNLEAWTTPMSFPITGSSVTANAGMQTFPLRYNPGNNQILDVRTGAVLDTKNLISLGGVNAKDNIWRIGNLLLMTPGDGQSGMSVFDAGDPSNIRLLDNLTGNIKQYSTSFQVWRNYVVLCTGSNDNGPSGSANMIGIDISNPNDIKVAFEINTSKFSSRYVHFQDEFAFGGGFTNYKKLNMETKAVVQEFSVPGDKLSNDFQAVPLGHILMTTGDGYHTNFFAHQTGLDRKAPTVGFHWPKANQTGMHVKSVLGFVINESLMGETVTDANIQVRPVSGGAAVAADVIHYQNGVVNFAPKTPLQENTTYEVKFIAGGVKDVAGNGMAEYKFLFSTGNSIDTNNPPVVSNVSMAPASPVASNTSISFTATATDTDGDALSYRWDFGDGTAQTAYSTSNTISHTFTTAGNYIVTVQAKDAEGEIGSKTKSLVVINAASGPRPTRSSSIIVDDAARRVWVVNSDNDNVAAINADNLSIVHNVAVGKHPTSVAVDGSSQVWVTCREDDKVYVINKSTGVVITSLQLAKGAQPIAVVFTPDGTTGYIAEYGKGRITKVNASTRTITGSVAVGPTPSALAITGNGERLLVSRFISGNTGGTVYSVNLNNFTAGTAIPLPIDNTTSDTEVAGRGIPNYVAGLAISPDNTKAWYVAKKDNILRGQQRDGNTPTFETSIRFLASPINLATNAEIVSSRKDIDNHGQPSSIAYSPDGNHIFLTEQGNNRLIVLNALNNQEIARYDVGLAPQGVAIDPTTKRVFTENFMSRSVSVYNASSMLTEGTSVLTNPSTISIVTSEKLSATVLKGKQIFYNAGEVKMAKDGYMSCASCHIDGREDGRVWDFTHRGEGFRNTVSLRGRAGTAHGRVHWSANFDEIQDFENDIRAHMGGTGFMTNAQFNTGTASKPLGDAKAGTSTDLDALAAYITSLNTFDASPNRGSDGSLTADAVAGKNLFQSLKCGSCHSGANFTNSSSGLMHDVGTINTNSGKRSNSTLLGIDAPTLRDVWATAPYLHDGSAATLADVLTTKNATNKHGATSSLSTTQINQLVAYLQQIDGSEPAAGASVSLVLASPLNGASLTTGQGIPLSITTDISNITEVKYYANGAVVASSTTAPFNSTWSNATENTYEVVAKVFHENGTATISKESIITVAPSFSKISGTYFGTAAWTSCSTCSYDKAFDNNTSTYFDANDANGAYTGLDAGSAKTVTRIRFYPRSGNTARMVGGKFQGSNTSSSAGFVDLHTISSEPTLAWQEVNLTSSTAYRYLRYLSPNGGYGNVAEIEFYTGTPGSNSTLRDPENPSSTVAGLEYKYFEGTWTVLPNFDALTSAETGNVSNFDMSLRNRTDNYGFKYTGYINITTEGTYTFYTSSDDGSKLYIGSTEVVNNDGLHGMQERSGTIGLKVGKHAITVVFFEGGGGEGLSVSYAGAGVTKQAIPNSVLFRNGGGTTDPGTLTKATGTAFGTTPWTSCTTCSADKVFDGNTATYFDANNADGAYAGIDAGTARVITRIRYYPRSSNPERMVGGKFQGSNTSNSTGFVDLYTVPSQPTNNWQQVDIPNTTGYRYLRYLSPNGGYGNVAEVEFYYNSSSTARAGSPESSIMTETNGETEVVVYPNPARSYVHLQFVAEKDGEAKIQILNSIGLSELSLERQVTAGSNTIEVQLGELKKGMHILILELGSRKLNKKIIVE